MIAHHIHCNVDPIGFSMRAPPIVLKPKYLDKVIQQCDDFKQILMNAFNNNNIVNFKTLIHQQNTVCKSNKIIQRYLNLMTVYPEIKNNNNYNANMIEEILLENMKNNKDCINEALLYAVKYYCIQLIPILFKANADVSIGKNKFAVT